MLTELLLLAGAAYGADKLGLVNISGAKKPRSTAPVQSAQQAGQQVAPSIPGHVIPAPGLVDPHSDSLLAQTFAAVDAAAKSNGLSGAPYVDPMGYWRDYSTGSLFQFHDPNTGAPMGKPGYMPLRYQQYAQAQDAAQAATAAAAAGGTDNTAADAMNAVKTGVAVAGAAATVATAAGVGGGAAATAGTVAAVAGSVLACLGPLPVAAVEGWHVLELSILRRFDGDRSLQVAMTLAPDGSGTTVLAIEVAADAAHLLEDDTAAAAAALYADHRHELVGIYESRLDAVNAAEGYARHWRDRRERERGCACEEIGA